MSDRASKNSLVLATSSVMMLAGAVCYSTLAGRSDNGAPLPVLLAMIVPVTASFVFLCIGLVVKGLVPGRRWVWPLNVTLPAVYGGLIQLCARLWSRGPNPLVRQETLETATRYWERLNVAFVVFALQVALLSLFVAADRRRVRGE
jgi:hypothetical protein